MNKHTVLNKIVFIIYVCLACKNLYAQPAENILVGTLALADGTSYTYKLQFKDSSGFINGYSITDVEGPDRTKALVTGTLNVFKKELSFRETFIVNTRSAVPRDSFCFVQARLKLSGLKKGKALKGNFTAYRRDGKTPCTQGSMTLYSAAGLLDKLMKLPGADTIARRLKEKIQPADTVTANVNIVQLEPGKTLEAFYEGNSAILEIWDDKTLDGDMITITQHGKPVLERYVLADRKKSISLSLPGNAPDTLMITAESEGTEPPNTAMVKLVSGDAAYYINAHTSFGKPVQIILKPKDSK